MIKCGEGCIPVCDFCKHCKHRKVFYWKYGITNGEPLKCKHPKHKNDKRFDYGSGYCEDFHCFRVK